MGQDNPEDGFRNGGKRIQEYGQVTGLMGVGRIASAGVRIQGWRQIGLRIGADGFRTAGGYLR